MDLNINLNISVRIFSSIYMYYISFFLTQAPIGFCTILILVILCPSSLENAVLSPDCLRRSGDSCSFSCAKGYTPSTRDELLCTTEGVWNNDTTKLCSSKLNIMKFIKIRKRNKGLFNYDEGF